MISQEGNYARFVVRGGNLGESEQPVVVQTEMEPLIEAPELLDETASDENRRREYICAVRQQPLEGHRRAYIALHNMSGFVDNPEVAMHDMGMRRVELRTDPSEGPRGKRVVGIQPENPVPAGPLNRSIQSVGLSIVGL